MSKEVKRYDHAGDHCGPQCGFEEAADGDWVRAADYDALLAERDALQRALDRQVPLHDAIQRAAGELPNGWEIRLCVERDAGWVELYDPDGNDIEDFATNNERLDYTVIDALEHALQGEQP